eukprot:CAMPEP_0172501648 /NCGR_PEP_ID=MMETSP1066-20121228/151968_1 /TAXON_ID=671091 /ORGANISM="Coscinodiscus wailesii, Strain CCMP2513" /LENGTH=314 /DNA_ID=CAMNT_0013276565 /DNA_START=250 /DNA_END=1194 /DNA_ORIENTATION=-
MSSSPTNTTPEPPKFVEIGANLLDPMFSGIYREKPRHDGDLSLVISRAKKANIDKIVITAGTPEESRQALSLARALGTDTFRSTVGVHPTRCNIFLENRDAVVEELRQICHDGMTDGTVCAMGELGLDYDREMFCPREVQKEGFLCQLTVAEEIGLPLFLHNRNTGMDLYDLLKENRERFTRGVVHSFDDSLELAERFMDLELYIGINGCSLKKEENLEVVKHIPMDKILLETDCPWCDIRQTHAGYKYVKTTFPTKKEKQFEAGCCVKNRNEPCHIIQVAEIVAGVKGVTVEELAKVCLKNSYEFYGQFERPA